MDFLLFRRMLTPVLLQVVFWIMVVASIYQAVHTFLATGNVGFALMYLIFGPICARIVVEVPMVLFRMNETLTDLHHDLTDGKLPGLKKDATVNEPTE